MQSSLNTGAFCYIAPHFITHMIDRMWNALVRIVEGWEILVLVSPYSLLCSAPQPLKRMCQHGWKFPELDKKKVVIIWILICFLF